MATASSRSQQAELCASSRDRVGQGVDADAELADLVGLLINLAVDAAGVQHQRGGQPADAAAYDDDFHAGTARNARIRAVKVIALRGNLPATGNWE